MECTFEAVKVFTSGLLVGGLVGFLGAAALLLNLMIEIKKQDSSRKKLQGEE